MKTHTTQTYYKLLLRFEGKELSLRKRFCMAYLKFLYTEKYADREEMVELAKEFRKTRRGGHRTVLEKLARAHFKKARQRKNMATCREGAREFNETLQKEKKGVFSEESLSKRSEIWKKIKAKHARENDHPQSKTYVITCPDGEQIAVHGLTRFAREMGMEHSPLHIQAKEPWREKGVKGYSARYWDPETDKHIPWYENCPLPPRLRKKYGLDDLE